MCGRFTQNYSWSEIHAFLTLFGTPRNLQPRYNIAPTTPVDVVRQGPEGRELLSMRWGLVPGWWKKPLKELPASFNARAESVANKPMFREAYRRQRCIIPASGFYEWTGGKGDKQPHLFTAADGGPILSIAGLWDQWRDPATAETLQSCTMVVGDASSWMKTYHDRLVVLLKPEQISPWLEGSLGVEALLPASDGILREWPVTRRMNKVDEGDDDPTIMAPIEMAGDAGVSQDLLC